MWPEKIKIYIKKYISVIPATISAKVILLYSSIVFFILLIVSVFILTTLRYSMSSSAEQDIKTGAHNVLRYLETHGSLDTTVFIHSDIPSHITLQIYDSAGTLLLDNGSAYSIKPLSDRVIDESIRANTPLPSSITGDDRTGISYYRTWTAPDGKTYFLHFFHEPEKENNFISLLTEQLLLLMLGSFLLTIILGMYVMKKSMAPIQHLSAALNELEVSKLSRRIALSDDKSEIHDLALSINQALDRIEYGYKQQQQFISDASHELRTPITVIAGYADLLDRWGKHDPEILDESLSAIKSETDYMKNLIERLLFFARSSNGSLSRHFLVFDTAQLLQDIYSEVTLIDKEHRILLTVNDSAMIYAEQGSVKQMLRIFIDNAIKYTPAGGEISLSCSKNERSVSFAVADTGIGIPKQDLERVFERFYRVDSSRTKDTGGSGLGLSLARHIAKANHAQLKLTSEEHKGTTITAVFSLDIPEKGKD